MLCEYVTGSFLRLWGGFAWARMSDGPPGCDARSGLELCRPEPVYVDGEARCMATPRESPLVEKGKRGYVCEHRAVSSIDLDGLGGCFGACGRGWEGVAGLIAPRLAGVCSILRVRTSARPAAGCR